MTDHLIRIIDRNINRQDDPVSLSGPRQYAPSYDRVRWLEALVEAFGRDVVDRFTFEPRGDWVFETWLEANPRKKTEPTILGSVPRHKRRNEGFCSECGDGYSKGYQADNGMCARCSLNARKRRYYATARGKANIDRNKAKYRAKKRAERSA